MGIKFKFGFDEFTELDFIFLNDILAQVKEQVKDIDIDYYELEYDYTKFIEVYGIDSVGNTLVNLYQISLFTQNEISSGWERLFVKMLDVKRSKTQGRDKMIFAVSNIKYLKEKYFIKEKD